jgi:hypothetical protein
MSNENEKTSEGKANAVANIIDFFKNNPKALYALGGAVVVIALAIAMGGGGGEEVLQMKTALTVGQTVTVRNPNIGDTWLTAVPKMGSEDTGEEKEQYICLVKGGATATVEEEGVITYIPYVKITIKDGDCQGKTGWTPRVNVTAK